MMDEKFKPRVLIIHEDITVLEKIVEAIEERVAVVTVVPDTRASLSQPDYYRYHMVLLSCGITTLSPLQFIRDLKAKAMTSMTPVVVMQQESAPEEYSRINLMLAGADAVIPAGIDAIDVAGFTSSLLEKHMTERLDPITGFITGAPLNRILENLCSDTDYEWHFVGVKLLGLLSYNQGYGYDAGNNMLRGVANLIDEVVAEQGEETDFVGRLSGSCFCIVTRTRRLDSICRNIRVKAERLIRRYYSSFELMKGYLTIEDGVYAGNYYLCEAIAAGILIPAKWDSSSSYLVDLTKDLLNVVQKEESGYRIITP